MFLQQQQQQQHCYIVTSRKTKSPIDLSCSPCLPIDVVNQVLESIKNRRGKINETVEGKKKRNICHRSSLSYQFAIDAKETTNTNESVVSHRGRLLLRVFFSSFFFSLSRSKRGIFICMNHLHPRNVLQRSYLFFFFFHSTSNIYIFSVSPFLPPPRTWTIIFTFWLVRTDLLINTFLRATRRAIFATRTF